MKDIREIYQALLEGNTLTDKNGGKIILENSVGYDFSRPENFEIYNRHEDLKRAYEEGSKVERFDTYSETWREVTCEPDWKFYFEYCIKGGISLPRWKAHKDLIKAYWEGAKIEYLGEVGVWREVDNPSWRECIKYRVK